ncbi:hypothetical protein Ahia01_001364600, partial [Argonauta hians]
TGSLQKTVKSPYLRERSALRKSKMLNKPRAGPVPLPLKCKNERYYAESRFRTKCIVTVKYRGKHLSKMPRYPSPDGTEVQVNQQHCGGNTLCVYRGNLVPNGKLFYA